MSEIEKREVLYIFYGVLFQHFFSPCVVCPSQINQIYITGAIIILGTVAKTIEVSFSNTDSQEREIIIIRSELKKRTRLAL